MVKRLGFVLLLLAAFGVFADQIPLEDIATYNPKTMVFTVSKNYVVNPGDVLIIPAGTKMEFGPLIGITVKGELLIRGEADRQVTLTSRRGMRGNGAPYDWTGITMFPSGRAEIKYAIISYAAIGIKSCCDNVALVNTVFLANGTNFQIGERQIYCVDREPISYEITQPLKNINSVIEGVDYDAIKGKKYIPARTWVLAPMAAAMITGGVIHCVKWSQYTKEYNNFAPGDPRFADKAEREATFKDLKDHTNLNMWLGLGLSAAGVGLGTYVTIFTIKF